MDKKRKVLIVDDEPDVTFLLSTVLEFNGFEVKITNTGKDALKELGQDTFDLFIVDYIMDDMNGMETIQEARQSLGLSDIKIILLTFKDLEAKELSVVSRENIVYLKKPFRKKAPFLESACTRVLTAP